MMTNATLTATATTDVTVSAIGSVTKTAATGNVVEIRTGAHMMATTGARELETRSMSAIETVVDATRIRAGVRERPGLIETTSATIVEATNDHLIVTGVIESWTMIVL